MYARCRLLAAARVPRSVMNFNFSCTRVKNERRPQYKREKQQIRVWKERQKEKCVQFRDLTIK